jgi:cellulose 1,4-beta-cellobiosidase
MKLQMKRLGLSISGSAILGSAILLGACATGPKPVLVTPATTPPAPAINPFVGARIYVNPEYAKTVEGLAATHPGEAGLIKKMATIPTAIWLSWIADTKDIPRYLDGALQEQKAGGQPVVTVFVIYDLPNRDCNAEASAGELPASPEGEARYQREYIDPIAAAFAAHPDQRIAVIMEPDSIANLVTNLENPKCQAAEGIYKRGVAYAISKLSLPNVFLYLDAAHAGWLGWPRNLVKSVPLYKEILTMAGGADRIRGFATDVSNYDPVKDPTNPPRDPKAAASDELGYIADLSKELTAAGITGKGFVVDTSRDGKAYVRTSPGNWCNIKGAGLGERPQAAPAPLVDAYLYVKVPGESDGIADPKAPRFDQNCASDDATPGAPQAGKMFESYFIDLLKNATPPL